LKYSGSAWVNGSVPSGSTVTDIPQNIAFSGDISPSSIGANQNDYNPTGLSTASTLRLTASAAYNITGLAGGADGRLILIHNIGSNTITLKDESASSAAANRFALNGDVVLNPDTSCILQYDSTSSRWRLFGDSPSAHIAASAAVHGLPSGANVLGNKSAAGEFVQRGTVSSMATVGAYSVSSVTSAVTFAVAFSSTPIVVAGGTTSGPDPFLAGACSITTTGFTLTAHVVNNTGAKSNVGWLALGA
jgi:hypothetical protein